MGDLVRAVLWMLVAVGLLTFAGVYARLGWLLLSRPGSNDFTIFYYTARMAADGHAMYRTLPASYGLEWQGPYLGNLNPPHFQLLMAPLVPLGYRGALVVWMLVNLAIVGTTARLVVRELQLRLGIKRVLLTALLVFASAAWTSVAVTGEMSLLLLLPFTLAWIAARRGLWGRAGMLLGVCASLKLFLLVFAAWFVVGRQWRAVAAMAGAATACVGAGVAAYGWTSLADWWNGLSQVSWWWLPMNVSVRGLAERWFDAGPPFASVIAAPEASRPFYLALASIVALVTAWRAWPAMRVVDADRAWPLLLVGALLISPLGWIYYLPLATAPLVALAARRQLAGPGAVGTGILILALGLLYVPMELTEKGQPSALATLALASAHGWGTLLLWVSLTLRPSTAASRPPEVRA